MIKKKIKKNKSLTKSQKKYYKMYPMNKDKVKPRGGKLIGVITFFFLAGVFGLFSQNVQHYVQYNVFMGISCLFIFAGLIYLIMPSKIE
jgi:hypothetical protein